jgi:hypothetical protein
LNVTRKERKKGRGWYYLVAHGYSCVQSQSDAYNGAQRRRGGKGRQRVRGRGAGSVRQAEEEEEEE